MKTPLTATCLSLGLAAAASADVIVLGADPWCPYNCEPGSDRPGYMVELAQEAMAGFGHEIRYVTVSWARGLRQAETGEIDGVIGAIVEEAPGFVFGPPMGDYRDNVVFRRGEALTLAELSDVSGLRIGAINGYEYFGPVSDYIERHRDDRSIVQYASGDDALTTNLRKLVAGRLDMVAEVEAVLDYNLALLGFADRVEVVQADESDDIFIAFSPALESSERYAAELTQGIAQLRETGRYDEIMARYGLGASGS